MDLPPGYPDYLPEPRNISVVDPVSRAIDHTKKMLFPIKAGKWFTLGFVAWIAHLGEGGGSNFNIPDTSGSGGSGSGSGIKPAVDFVMDNLSLVVTIGVVVLVLGIGIGLLVTWVSSRGKFMFVDNVLNDDCKVEEPWRRFAEHGKNLFWVRIWLGLIGLLVFLIAAGIGGTLAWPDIRAATFASAALLGLLVGLAILLLFSIPLAIAGALIDDFVVPAMYLHGESVRPAWQRVKREIIAGNVGTIAVFYLMKFLLGLVIAVLAVVGTCLTCCIAVIPYIGTVILLPLIVFARSYVLYFIEQFGPAWQLFPREPESPAY